MESLPSFTNLKLDPKEQQNQESCSQISSPRSLNQGQNSLEDALPKLCLQNEEKSISTMETPHTPTVTTTASPIPATPPPLLIEESKGVSDTRFVI